MSSHSKHSKNNKYFSIILAVLLTVLVAIAVAIIIVEHLRGKADLNTESSSTQSIYTSSVPEISSEEPVESVYIPEASEITVVSKPTSKPKQTASNTASLKEKVEAVKQTEQNTIQVQTSIDTSGLKKKKVQLAVKYLAQNPELPTGCEITSLTTVLNYYGFDVDKVTMANDYLSKAEAPANFWKVFLGDPTKKTGFGCYAQPIADAANKYLKEQNADYVAKNISGTSFEKLLSIVENGDPVVIWGTMGMKKPYTTYKWTIDGEAIQWIAPEHCLVLIGYDLDRGVAIMSDPQIGLVSYKLDTVKARYLAIHSQCVVLESTAPEDSEPPESSSDESNTSNESSSGESSSGETSSGDNSSDTSSGEDGSSSDTVTTTPEGTEPPSSTPEEDNGDSSDSNDDESPEESSSNEEGIDNNTPTD